MLFLKLLNGHNYDKFASYGLHGYVRPTYKEKNPYCQIRATPGTNQYSCFYRGGILTL